MRRVTEKCTDPQTCSAQRDHPFIPSLLSMLAGSGRVEKLWGAVVADLTDPDVDPQPSAGRKLAVLLRLSLKHLDPDERVCVPQALVAELLSVRQTSAEV